jgi:hypothetical protein
MAIYNVKAPDGSIVKVSAPEGASQDEIIAYAQENYKPETEGFLPQVGRQVMTNINQAAANIGRAVPALDDIGASLGLGNSQRILAESDRRPVSGGARFAGDVLAMAPLGVAAGASIPLQALYSGIGTLATSKDPRASDFAVGAAAGGIGAKLGASLASRSVLNPEQQAMLQATKEARSAGYTLPPSMMNPSSPVANMLEGFAGKLTTGQVASIKNQGVTNAKVATALGLPLDEPITPAALSAIRSDAGKAYEGVRGAGRVIADNQYFDDLRGIAAKYSGAEKDFPELAKTEVTQIVQAAAKPDFDSGSAIDLIRILRDKADAAYRAGDKGLGQAYKGVTSAVEGVLERNLSSAGNDSAVSALREARRTIAKTYTVENALNPATGAINPQKLTKDLAKGRLSGELAQIARTARAFPPAMKETTSSMPGTSPLDWAAGGIASASTANPLMLASVLARPAVRSAITSPIGQQMLSPSVPRNMIPGLLDAVGVSPYSAQLGALLGQAGAKQ